MPTIFEYMPNDANDTTAQAFITEFVTTGDAIGLTIQGDSSSTPYESLGPALEGIKITSSIPGLNFPNLITHVNVFITLDTLVEYVLFHDKQTRMAELMFISATSFPSTSMSRIR